MTGKVKVIREVAEAIEYLRGLEKYYDNDNKILKSHNGNWDAAQALNNITHLELAEILIKGYEVEKTPLELLEDYEKEYANLDIYQDPFVDGVNKTIKFFKEKFEIKGINQK